ncbi:hypothetical protein Chor_001179 [Crotalus horridus]
MEEHNGSAESPLLSPGRHTAIKCGWLRKQGGFVKTWHTRWFVLKGEQLYYFKDEDEAKPLSLAMQCKVWEFYKVRARYLRALACLCKVILGQQNW